MPNIHDYAIQNGYTTRNIGPFLELYKNGEAVICSKYSDDLREYIDKQKKAGK